ncbi:hypothetical protein ABFA07_004883 [Porites harrisoni]
MAARMQRLDVDLEKCYENDLDWTLLPENLRKICQLFGKGMKQRETTVLLGILTMISFCMGHTSTSVNDFWTEPIILWIAIVLPTEYQHRSL